jgi:hypothetical protein
MLARVFTLSIISLGFFVCCGCRSSHHSQSPNISTACPPITHVLESEPELEGRLSAAQKISNRQIRQEALEGLAVSAAKAGNTKFVKKVLTHMSDQAKRHESASNCAYYLASAGESQGATSIAITIPDADLRNKALKRIAVLE